MLKIERFMKKLRESEKAQGIVEYALVLAFVAVVAGALGTNGELTKKVQGAFDSIQKAFAVSSDSSNVNKDTQQNNSGNNG